MTKDRASTLGVGLLVFGGWFLGVGSSLSAHHSDAAYDNSRPVTLQGTVTKFSWENPHIRVWLDVRDGDGGRTTWEVEGNPPGRIGGRGLKDALKPGAAVTMTVYVSKDRSRKTARGYDLTLADSRRFVIGDESDSP